MFLHSVVRYIIFGRECFESFVVKSDTPLKCLSFILWFHIVVHNGQTHSCVFNYNRQYAVKSEDMEGKLKQNTKHFGSTDFAVGRIFLLSKFLLFIMVSSFARGAPLDQPLPSSIYLFLFSFFLVLSLVSR